jgi:hypothetical protein
LENPGPVFAKATPDKKLHPGKQRQAEKRPIFINSIKAEGDNMISSYSLWIKISAIALTMIK